MEPFFSCHVASHSISNTNLCTAANGLSVELQVQLQVQLKYTFMQCTQIDIHNRGNECACEPKICRFHFKPMNPSMVISQAQSNFSSAIMTTVTTNCFVHASGFVSPHSTSAPALPLQLIAPIHTALLLHHHLPFVLFPCLDVLKAFVIYTKREVLQSPSSISIACIHSRLSLNRPCVSLASCSICPLRRPSRRSIRGRPAWLLEMGCRRLRPLVCAFRSALHSLARA